jgi:hypothetical protein
MMLEPLDVTCFHEAGHVVVNSTIGWRPDLIRIFFDGAPNRPYDGATATVRPTPRACEDYADILTSLFAGNIAELLCQTSGPWNATAIIQRAISPEFNVQDGDERFDCTEAKRHFSRCGQGISQTEAFLIAAGTAYEMLAEDTNWELVRTIQAAVRDRYLAPAKVEKGWYYDVQIEQLPEAVLEQLRPLWRY